MALLYSSRPSNGARDLARTMGIKRIKREGSRFTGRRHPTVINWGNSELPAWGERCRIVNDPDAVATAANKLKFLEQMTRAGLEHLVPEYTTDKEVAKKWLGHSLVVCRKTLTGHSGAGIVIAETEDEIVDAPLYTKYIPKKDEYRVHIVKGRAIDMARKARRLDVDEPNWRVRSHNNGFVYAREDCNPPQEVIDAARQAFEHSGLDFGAVDVIYNNRQGKAFVLEINTAPGLEGQTLDNYARELRRF